MRFDTNENGKASGSCVFEAHVSEEERPSLDEGCNEFGDAVVIQLEGPLATEVFKLQVRAQERCHVMLNVWIREFFAGKLGAQRGVDCEDVGECLCIVLA